MDPKQSPRLIFEPQTMPEDFNEAPASTAEEPYNPYHPKGWARIGAVATRIAMWYSEEVRSPYSIEKETLQFRGKIAVIGMTVLSSALVFNLGGAVYNNPAVNALSDVEKERADCLAEIEPTLPSEVESERRNECNDIGIPEAEK